VKRILTGVVLLVTLLIPAGATAGTAEEIGHLLQYIEQSECVFIRNSEEHDSVAALEHIRMKYGYVKSRVNTAEDFIEYAATKSSLSGKPYLVRCEGVDLLTAEWLKAELARFRQPKTEPAAGR